MDYGFCGESNSICLDHFHIDHQMDLLLPFFFPLLCSLDSSLPSVTPAN